jgi:glycosyltransferase involved in cell wall biosynthesis
MEDIQKPMVSICSTTYNLEKYIAEAIESWLIQKTNFDFEIIICDDCSKDNTTKIIESYIEKYPGKIRLLIADKNQGMMPNFIWSLESAEGKYIAVCDGDDYWIDENKLQMQIDFLEANPEFSSCYTNSLVKNELTNEFVVAKKYVWDEANTVDLFEHNDFHNDNIPLSPGHISAFVFRNDLIEKYPEWFYKIDGVTDFPLYLMISKFGKAKFFNVNTSVYRNHPKSTSTVDYEFIRLNIGRINIYNCLNIFFENKYKKVVDNYLNKHYNRIIKFCIRKRLIIKAVYFESKKMQNLYFVKNTNNIKFNQ